MLSRLELLVIDTAVELDGLQSYPLLRNDRDDVVPPHHLSPLLPHVVDAQIHVRHAYHTRSQDSVVAHVVSQVPILSNLTLSKLKGLIYSSDLLYKSVYRLL